MKGFENLGIVSQFLDEYHKLKNVMRKHLPSHQKLVTVRGAAEAHTNLGAPSKLLDEDHKAKEYHERALSVTMETGD